ncbi:LPXTG cell wall anchor domain-containing protein, partial [uncultured Dubosiella sp.]|uniref:LPXTG cell wall anchor domain-containing protein n=3 Tax=uncultured Dubosiella sp. TaxID=1937011 RepID=UPI0026F05146
PQEKPIDTTVKPTTNNQTIKVVQVKAEETKQTEESDAKHSPNTGIAIHKTSSLFASLLGMIGLGSVVGKRRKF